MPLLLTSFVVDGEAGVGVCDVDAGALERRRRGDVDVPPEVAVHDVGGAVLALEEQDLRLADQGAHADVAVELLLLAVDDLILQRSGHGLVDLRAPFALETVGDVHEHTHGDVEDSAGVYFGAVGVCSGVVAPQHPLTSPRNDGADALLRELLAGLLVEATVLGVGSKILLDDRHSLVAAGLHRDAVVAEVGTHELDRCQRAEVVVVAEVIGGLRPEYLRALAGEGVVLLPCDRLLDGIDGLRAAVYQRQVGEDEGVPVAVDLLAGRDHSVVDRRAVAPAGCDDQVDDCVLLGVEQGDGAEAAILAGGGDAADDVGVLYQRVVDLVEAGRQVAGELCILFQAGDDDRALGEVVVHGVVLALDVVAGVVAGLGDGQGVEDDGGAGELSAAACEAQGRGRLRLLSVLAGSGIQHVDDVDGADVADGVVEVRVHDFAEGEGAPVGCIPELFLRVDQVADLHGLVDDAGLVEAAHEVDGRGADIDRRGARLHGALCHGLADVAVGAVEVLVCHVLVLLCIKLDSRGLGCLKADGRSFWRAG